MSGSGSPTRARTWDLRINSPSLYRLSYRGIRDLQNQNPTAVLQMRHRMKGPNYTNPGRGVPQLALTRHFGIQQAAGVSSRVCGAFQSLSTACYSGHATIQEITVARAGPWSGRSRRTQPGILDPQLVTYGLIVLSRVALGVQWMFSICCFTRSATS